MLKVGDMVEDKIQYANGVKYQGKVTEVHGNGWFTVLWDMGSYTTEDQHQENELVKLVPSNRFNFVIFQNYDGSVEGKLIPRETYNRLFPDNV